MYVQLVKKKRSDFLANPVQFQYVSPAILRFHNTPLRHTFHVDDFPELSLHTLAANDYTYLKRGTTETILNH